MISSVFIDMAFIYIQSLLSSISPALDHVWVALLISLIIFAVILSIIVSAFVVVFSWLERKIIARAQSRRGPVYVGRFGILQNIADLIKLIIKENIVPEMADKRLFLAALPAVYALYFLVLAFLPLTSTFVGIGTSIGLILVFMLLSFVPIILFIAGWTSGNKFGSISSQRSIVMLLSYEIPLILILASIALVAHSYSLTSIVEAQSHIWYAAIIPIGFILFLIIMVAEMERPPFDLREADSELISGWLTDVSAPYYALSLFLDYTRVFVGALIITLLFLGGWNGPVLPPFAWLMIKISAITVLLILIRATTVRMRIGNVLRLGWLYLLPISVINLFITFALFVR